MGSDFEKIAAAVGSQPDVVKKLDQVLTCPTDRAYILCSFTDCLHNVKGVCSIFTVVDQEQHATGEACNRYVKSS